MVSACAVCDPRIRARHHVPGLPMSSLSSRQRAWCAIDFGTSNSAVAVPQGAQSLSLVPLEGAQVTMPTAVFYRADDPNALEAPLRIWARGTGGLRGRG